MQTFNSDQSCDATALKNFLDVLGLRNKLKVLWVFVNEAMNDINLLHCLQERGQKGLRREVFRRLGAALLPLAVKDGRCMPDLPVHVGTEEDASR